MCVCFSSKELRELAAVDVELVKTPEKIGSESLQMNCGDMDKDYERDS